MGIASETYTLVSELNTVFKKYVPKVQDIGALDT